MLKLVGPEQAMMQKPIASVDHLGSSFVVTGTELVVRVPACVW
jgi:hypothetical protein